MGDYKKQTNEQYIQAIGVSEGKKRERGQKVYLNKQWLRTSQNCGEIWASKFMKLIDYPTISIQTIFSKTHNRTVKNLRQRENPRGSK